MQKVGVVVLHYNGGKDTEECLESLSKIVLPEDYQLEIFVVDNGSEKKFTVDSSQLTVENLKIIRNKKNLGFTGGNNVGIRQALADGAEYVLILNNDTIVDKNFLAELLSVFENDNTIGIATPKIYFAKGFEYHKDRYKEKEKGKVLWYAGGIMNWANVIGYHRGVDEVDTGQFEKPVELDYASGCCMLVRKSVFEEVGPFDDKYYLYYEDSDLSERVKRKGYKILYAPQAVIWHKNAATAGGSGSALQDYYISRNRMLFGMRYAPIRSKISLLRESLRILYSGRKWQKTGITDFYLQKFGRGSFKVD